MNTPTLRRTTLAVTGMAMLCGFTRGDEQATDPRVLVANLNGDGRPEKITLKSLAEKEQGMFYQIVVMDSSDALLWKSPEVFDSDHPLAFGEWHFGISMPQLAADVDQDGKVELIVPAPQSDVSPSYFRVLQWTGEAFVPKHSHALTGKGQKGAAFAWTKSPARSDYWVEQWLGSSAEGGWVVKLDCYPEDAVLRTAIGVISAKGDGFQLIRWIEPPAKLVTTAADDPPAAQAVIYRARLSARDHANSSGAALTTVIDILRQDRANFHRDIHRDAEDQTDERFATTEAREALASMPVSVTGDEKAEARIINGTPVVEVRVTEGALRVEIANE